ncbi:EF-P lysine aminoacylase GenX [bacterium]|nr:EF-P lysine aminoacylase GenX [bacterium]
MIPTPLEPSASLSVLHLRAWILQQTRRYFDRAGYMEVDTPVLSADVIVDPWIEPFVTPYVPDATQWNASGLRPYYLQTSPEFSMKRLIAAGAKAIYQLGKVFRNGEVGNRHNPEFTMLEWYRVGDDFEAQIRFTEQYVTDLISAVLQRPELLPATQTTRLAELLNRTPFECLPYEAAFERLTGVAVLQAPMTALHAIAKQYGLCPPPSLDLTDRDGWLNWLLAELIEPQLGRDRPTFLIDYPASQAALAKTVTRPDGITVAKRFELYIDGIEYCNGYHELTNPEELHRRNIESAAIRQAAQVRPLPVESRLVSVMAGGLPECSGVALGFDRLVMLIAGTTRIADVLPFAWDRA